MFEWKMQVTRLLVYNADYDLFGWLHTAANTLQNQFEVSFVLWVVPYSTMRGSRTKIVVYKRTHKSILLTTLIVHL